MREFDELLDEVLREDARVEPWPGIEARVLARVRMETATAASRWRMFAVWAGGLGVVTVAIALFCLLPRTEPARLGAPALHQDGRVVEGAREEASLRPGLPSGAKAPSKPMMYGTAEAVPLSKTGLSADLGARGVKAAGRVAVSRVVVSGVRAERQEEVRLPKMETFPAVAQSGGFLPEQEGDDWRDGLRAVVKSPQVAKALLELKAEQEQPLVSEIEPKPL